jgi:D-methionine transport system ATP-binding protein
MPVVSLRGVSKVYPPTTKGGKPVVAIDDVSLDVEAGDVYGIIGYSGAGKSTLVRLVNALERATGGAILVNGQDIATLPERALRPVRLGIGMIFQQFNLFNSRTVAGNIAYPLEVAGRPKEERQNRVAELLDFVGLADKARAYPDQLSGGQKQRVAIARAIVTDPAIILADEPTGALDTKTGEDILALFKSLNKQGRTIIIVTHDLKVAQHCQREIYLRDGKIVESDIPFAAAAH